MADRKISDRHEIPAPRVCRLSASIRTGASNSRWSWTAGGASFFAYGFTQMLEAALLLSTFASGVLKRTPAVA
jgi:hypothetical protein